MSILAKIVFVIHILVCIILIAIVMMQSSEQSGASGTITGGATTSFFDKNKGRTREGMLKKLTVILGVTFGITTLIFGILYPYL